MARPLKQGLDYYPLDVEFYRDIKVRRLNHAFGAASTVILLTLLGAVYKDEGYYAEWNEDLCFLVAADSMATEELVTAVVRKALEVGLFDQACFERYGILTSKAIQRHYLAATYKRKEVKVVAEYLLVPEDARPNLRLLSGEPVASQPTKTPTPVTAKKPPVATSALASAPESERQGGNLVPAASAKMPENTHVQEQVWSEEAAPSRAGDSGVPTFGDNELASLAAAIPPEPVVATLPTIAADSAGFPGQTAPANLADSVGFPGQTAPANLADSAGGSCQTVSAISTDSVQAPAPTAPTAPAPQTVLMPTTAAPQTAPASSGKVAVFPTQSASELKATVAYRAWCELWRVPNRLVQKELARLVNEYGDAVVGQALQIAGEKQVQAAHGLSFVRSCLLEWQEAGAEDLASIATYQAQRARKFSREQSGSKRSFSQPAAAKNALDSSVVGADWDQIPTAPVDRQTWLRLQKECYLFMGEAYEIDESYHATPAELAWIHQETADYHSPVYLQANQRNQG